ncbi:hypothetical protein SISSUDRAFT_1064481 [Sistotremastrum suecicum HHB10207 ss-3]|uniref:Cyclin-like domain-containing protein n=1 Tax=Sistotremastrum suecicum HHB10207 ss-3 TaxID=1314776 RepID=A0A166ALC0_9AGAM|nr:hypothetical protein SISSUDRAFT_1064481 [Sistotremastrum suecicum HHB10207 ss-3]
MSAATASLPHPSHLFRWSWKASPKPEPRPYQLPPISCFDQHHSSPIRKTHPTPPPSPPSEEEETVSPRDPDNEMPWYGNNANMSVIAEKTAEMVCYLWFVGGSEARRAARIRKSHHHSQGSSPTYPRFSDAARQFSPSPTFTQYMSKILEMTQVSQSVIVLSLHYIHSLRSNNHLTDGQPGSEFRVAVVALMMANKFMDDNTYTNKTWSEVAGIELEEINRMEREFLIGIDYSLACNAGTYDSWEQLLKGFVHARERDLQLNQYMRRQAPKIPQNVSTPAVTFSGPSYRARSSSPLPSLKTPFTFTAPLPSSSQTHAATHTYPTSHAPDAMQEESEYARSGVKRSALAAFSPSISSARPHKRVIALDMRGVRSVHGPQSAVVPGSSSMGMPGAAEAFSRLSLSNGARFYPETRASSGSSYPHVSTPASSETRLQQPQQQQQQPSQMLAAPYHADIQSVHQQQPQNLYFYKLGRSPQDSTAEESHVRKARLRYAPLQAYQNQRPAAPVLPRQPLMVQSANTSPATLGPAFAVTGPIRHLLHAQHQLSNPALLTPSASPSTRQAPIEPLTLPSISPHSYGQQPSRYHDSQDYYSHASVPRTPAFSNQGVTVASSTYGTEASRTTTPARRSVPEASFANAGPPGVEWTSTPTAEPAHYETGYHYYHPHTYRSRRL